MAVEPEGPRSRTEVLRVRPTLGSTLLVIAAIGTAVVLGRVVVAARRPLGWAFATLVVAWLVSAVIALLSRWMRRGVALAVTIVGVVVLVAGTWLGVIANLRAETRHIRTSLPAAAERLERRYEAAADLRLAQRVRGFVREMDERFSTSAAVTKAAGTAPVYFVTGVLLLFFLAYGPRYLAGALSQIRDPAKREAVATVFGRASDRARNYLLVNVLQVAAVTALATLVFYVVGLPAPFVLGLTLGSLSAIPYLGAILGGVPAVLLAAAEPGQRVVFIVATMVISVQFAEGLLRRRLDPRTVHVGPALVLIVAVIGFELYGVGGAVYSAVALVFVLALLDAWSTVRPVSVASPSGPDAEPTVVADHAAGGERERGHAG